MADWYFRNNQKNLVSCPGCRNLVRTDQEFCPYCAKRLRAEGGMRGWYKKLLSYPFAATRLLMGIIIAGFMLQMLADSLLPTRFHNPTGGGFFSMLTSYTLTYMRLGSNFHPFVADYGQVWRFVTSCFLHFGLMHIVFNSIAFWDLGRLAERLWGPRQVFATFILTGIAGSLGSFLWNMALSSPKHSAGASGAICGVLGLFLGAYYRSRYQVGEHLGGHLIRWAVYILVFGLVARADNAAHIGGMLAGAVMGYFLPPTQHSRNLARDSKIWNAATALSLVLLLAAIVFAVVFYLQGPEYVVLLLSRL